MVSGQVTVFMGQDGKHFLGTHGKQEGKAQDEVVAMGTKQAKTGYLCNGCIEGAVYDYPMDGRAVEFPGHASQHFKEFWGFFRGNFPAFRRGNWGKEGTQGDKQQAENAQAEQAQFEE